MQRIPNDQLRLTEDLRCWQGNAPFTGIGYTLGPQNQLLSESPYVEGWLEGVGRDWFVDKPSQLESETTYKQNMRHGRRQVWHSNGKRKLDLSFEYDILVKQTAWDYAGNLVSVYHIKEGDAFYATLQTLRGLEK